MTASYKKLWKRISDYPAPTQSQSVTYPRSLNLDTHSNGYRLRSRVISNLMVAEYWEETQSGSQNESSSICSIKTRICLDWNGWILLTIYGCILSCISLKSLCTQNTFCCTKPCSIFYKKIIFGQINLSNTWVSNNDNILWWSILLTLQVCISEPACIIISAKTEPGLLVIPLGAVSRAGRVCLVFIGVNICSSCRCCAAGTWIRDERRKELWQLQLITTTITAIGGCWGKFLLPGKTFLFTIQRRGSGPAHRDARQSHAGFRTLTKWMKTCCFAHTHTSSYVCGHAQIRTWMRVHNNTLLPLPHLSCTLSHTNNQSFLWADTIVPPPQPLHVSLTHTLTCSFNHDWLMPALRHSVQSDRVPRAH